MKDSLNLAVLSSGCLWHMRGCKVTFSVASESRVKPLPPHTLPSLKTITLFYEDTEAHLPLHIWHLPSLSSCLVALPALPTHSQDFQKGLLLRTLCQEYKLTGTGIYQPTEMAEDFRATGMCLYPGRLQSGVGFLSFLDLVPRARLEELQ